MAASGQRDVKWIDVRHSRTPPKHPPYLCLTDLRQGLRGVASILVVNAHICRSLAPYYLSPAMAEAGPFALFQLPFFRLILMGRPSIAIFAILTGYVAAMRPIKQARAGMADQALSNIAKTAFRRTGRFVFPSMIATTVAWLWCELGAFRIATHVDSNWIRDTSPVPSSSFAGAFWGLFDNLMSTWVSGRNGYDPIQWTLTYLLKGSMMTYLALFATVYVKPRSRMLILCGLYVFMYMSGDGTLYSSSQRPLSVLTRRSAHRHSCNHRDPSRRARFRFIYPRICVESPNPTHSHLFYLHNHWLVRLFLPGRPR